MLPHLTVYTRRCIKQIGLFPTESTLIKWSEVISVSFNTICNNQDTSKNISTLHEDCFSTRCFRFVPQNILQSVHNKSTNTISNIVEEQLSRNLVLPMPIIVQALVQARTTTLMTHVTLFFLSYSHNIISLTEAGNHNARRILSLAVRLNEYSGYRLKSRGPQINISMFLTFSRSLFRLPVELVKTKKISMSIYDSTFLFLDLTT